MSVASNPVDNHADLLAGVDLGHLLGVAAENLRDGWSLRQAQDRLPGFTIHEEIGRGGMGVVFRATDRASGNIVAVKLLRPSVAADARMRQRLLKEANALLSLDHPGIVKLKWPVVGGSPADPSYLVMDYVEGESLAAILKRGRVEPASALRIFRDICNALHYAHCRGVLHRDIKPANIHITSDGRAMLLDFGIAKAEGGHFTGSLVGETACTPSYAAPEVLNGCEATASSDLFSLGLTLFEMLTGHLPAGRPLAPSQVCRVSPGVDEVVFRAMEREPAQRYDSVRALADALDRQTATMGTLRRWLIVGSLAAALVTAAAGIAIVHWSRSEKPEQSNRPLSKNIVSSPTESPVVDRMVYAPDIHEITPAMEELARLLVSHEWLHQDHLYAAEINRFYTDGKWNDKFPWDYWIINGDTFRIQFFRPDWLTQPGPNGLNLTFDENFQNYSGKYLDHKGREHLLTGRRLGPVTPGAFNKAEKSKTNPLIPEAAAYVPGIKISPDLEAFGRVIVGYEWEYYDSLFFPGPLRFRPSGKWHDQWKWNYWIAAPGVIHIQHWDPVYKPEAAIILTFDAHWQTYSGSFEDKRGTHKLTGKRLAPISDRR